MAAKPRLRTVLFACFASGAAGEARCDEPSLVADRPGFGESANTVSPHRLQVEAGLNWTRIDELARTADGPELLLRVGLTRSLELRFLAPDWSLARDAGSWASGWADVSLGAKGHASLGGNDFSWRATLYCPSGSPGFSSERFDPELAAAWSRALSERWSLGATVSQRWLRLSRVSLTSPSLALARSLGPHLGAFVEYGAVLGDGVPPAHKLDNGYTWTPDPATQIDVSLGIALSPAAPSFFVGAGVSHRF